MSSMYVFTPKRGCPICHVLLTVLIVQETSSVAYNLGETQTCNYFFLLFGREDSVEILASV